ncbi:MAG: hypothetical protein H5T76_21895, partial [Streptomyces sp.]|nr:hypothetical protein [Streptomyces sp.]
MADCEMVLRFLAFRMTPPEKYVREDFDGFLADAMHWINRLGVDEHLEWIRQSSLRTAATGRQIWERVADVYPRLQFLPRTEA